MFDRMCSRPKKVWTNVLIYLDASLLNPGYSAEAAFFANPRYFTESTLFCQYAVFYWIRGILRYFPGSFLSGYSFIIFILKLFFLFYINFVFKVLIKKKDIFT